MTRVGYPGGASGQDRCPPGPSPTPVLSADNLDQAPEAVQLANALQIACSAFRKYLEKQAEGKLLGDLTIVDSCNIRYTMYDPARMYLYRKGNLNWNSVYATIEGRFQTQDGILQRTGNSAQVAATTADKDQSGEIRTAAESTWQEFRQRTACILNPNVAPCFQQK